MSISSIFASVNQINKEIAQLEKNLADETKKEADKIKKINDIQKSITRNTSESLLQSKYRQIQSHQNDIVKIAEKKAELSKKVSQKRLKLGELNKKLQKAQEEENKKQQQEQDKIQKSYENRINQLTNQLKESITVNINNFDPNILEPDLAEVQYDVFISHAYEDKEDFVRELAETLRNDYGVNVWYDDFSIKWGDDLRIAIDKGLKASRFGIVILSKNFISKGWTNYELNGLFQKEMTFGKTILPIWHNITKDEVQKYSFSLAGKKALSTSMFTVKEIAEEMKRLLVSVE